MRQDVQRRWMGAHNPRLLRVGIGENTALLVRDRVGEVPGAEAVYVVDGEGAAHSSIVNVSCR